MVFLILVVLCPYLAQVSGFGSLGLGRIASRVPKHKEIRQILHATTELTAALTLLADACVMTAGLYPYGRKKD